MNESNTAGGDIEDKYLLRTALAPLEAQIDIDEVVDRLIGEFGNIRGLLEAMPAHLRSVPHLPTVVVEYLSNLREILALDITEQLENSLQTNYPRRNQIVGRQGILHHLSDESSDHA